MKLVLSAVACIVASATLSSAAEPRLHLRHVADYEYDEVGAYNNPNKYVNGRGNHGKGAAKRKARSAARKVKNKTKKDARATKKAARNVGKKAKKADRRAAKKIGKKGKKVGKKVKNCANACKPLTKNTGHTKISISGCKCFMYEEEPLADFFEMYEENEIDFIAEFLFDSYDEDSYDDEDDESDSEDYYDDEEEDSAEDYYSYN